MSKTEETWNTETPVETPKAEHPDPDGALNIRFRFTGKKSTLIGIIDAFKENIIDSVWIDGHLENVTIEMFLEDGMNRDPQTVTPKKG